jgi:putative membrane protein
MKIRYTFIAAAVTLQLAALTAAAQQPDTTRKPDTPIATDRGGTNVPQDTTSRPDSASASQRSESVTTEEFVQKAASDGMAEVELGKLAQQKSTNPDVRAFGQHMVKDHSAANEKLKAAAQQANVTVPSTMDPQHRQMVQSLQKLQGDAFDAAYAEHMHKDHDTAVALFESAAQSPVVAPPLRQFAQNTLPTLQEHLEEAEDLNANPRSEH